MDSTTLESNDLTVDDTLTIATSLFQGTRIQKF